MNSTIIFFLETINGNRVKNTIVLCKSIYPDSSWTAYVGDHYEVESDNTTRSYYFLGGQRIAMRIQQGQNDMLGATLFDIGLAGLIGMK
ncbi:MAG: hypothetical protein JXA42_19065 [Anaerolineales bacterium]|nr:hypothetical protein [Anaerolineales bacterium]